MASVSKSYRISDTQLHFILCIVYQVACVDRVDAQVGNIKGDESSARPEHAVCEALVVSLGIRASYGGMSHDTGLLKRAMHTWRARFADPHADWLQTITDMYNTQSMQECVPLESVRKMLRREDGVLQVGDIPLEACDFHCCRVSDEIARSITEDVLHVPRFLKLVDGAEVKAVLERLMWRYRSGVSVKKALEGDVDQAVTPSQDGSEEAVIWREELRNHIDDWCRRFRKRYGL